MLVVVVRCPRQDSIHGARREGIMPVVEIGVLSVEEYEVFIGPTFVRFGRLLYEGALHMPVNYWYLSNLQQIYSIA